MQNWREENTKLRKVGMESRQGSTKEMEPLLEADLQRLIQQTVVVASIGTQIFIFLFL